MTCVVTACPHSAGPSVGSVSSFNSDLLVKMASHQINLTLPKTHMDSNVYFLVNSGSAAHFRGVPLKQNHRK